MLVARLRGFNLKLVLDFGAAWRTGVGTAELPPMCSSRQNNLSTRILEVKRVSAKPYKQ